MGPKLLDFLSKYYEHEVNNLGMKAVYRHTDLKNILLLTGTIKYTLKLRF
jgi:hypothetical protein